jgi:hypothetical protein
MRNTYKIILIALLSGLLFTPFYPVIIVPEWELVFVNEDGTPAPSISIEQSWKDYSLGWISGEQSEQKLQTDANGYVKLPARQIRVSIFQILSSKIRDAIVSINPHASFGPSTTIICQGTEKCVVKYKGDIEKPQRVVLW